MPILREAGRLVVELDRLSELREHIINSKSPRRTEVRRLGAEARKTRVQLLLLERRLDELAGKNGHDLGAALAADAREATS
jgi:hypothetical protein